MTELLPVQIGKYSITRLIGQGGMAIVYLGHDPDTGASVAIKTTKADLTKDLRQIAVWHFVGELATKGLHHKAIMAIHDVGSWDDGRPYIAMEYVEGLSVDELMSDLKAAGQRLPLVEQLDIVQQVCEGLECAHENKIVHLDIKPANVVRRRCDGSIKIADFGLAVAIAHSASSNSTNVVGTLGYIAPERWKGEKTGAQADIFSTGVLLYYLLTGLKPFSVEGPVSPAGVSAPIKQVKPSRADEDGSLGGEQIGSSTAGEGGFTELFRALSASSKGVSPTYESHGPSPRNDAASVAYKTVNEPHPPLSNHLSDYPAPRPNPGSGTCEEPG